MNSVRLVSRKTSTFHDFPYTSPERKCFHCWIVNVTAPGPDHCRHACVYCYAREAIYTRSGAGMSVYSNLAELVEADLRRVSLCPPVMLCTASDPCQEVPEVREQTAGLVRLLMEWGVSFGITTKGDARFLLRLPGFAAYPNKSVAVTIEGTGEMLPLLSPGAPPYEIRLAAVRDLAAAGVATAVRLDPAFPHLFRACYGDGWFEPVRAMVRDFASAGARHVVCSTGRLSKARPGGRPGSWWQVRDATAAISEPEARRFESDYRYERTWAGSGYRLVESERRDFHGRLRAEVEARGMTYATCQELPAVADSPGLAHCEGIALPFTAKGGDGRFHPVPGCTANCHVSCPDKSSPPCGRPGLMTAAPLRMGLLR